MAELKGTDRQGDFVHKSQKMAAEEGFRNVSKRWYDKCKPIDWAIEQMHLDQRKVVDHKLPLSEVVPTVNDEGRFCMLIDGEEYYPTTHALELMAQKTGSSATNLFRNWGGDGAENGDGQMLSAVCRHLFKKMDPDKEWLFRTWESSDGQQGTLRAMLTDRYAVINNVWMLETMKELLPGGLVSHWRSDADTIWGNILVPDTIRPESDSDYGGMFSISNCEVGRRRFSALASIFRAICMNGCIWDQVSGSRIHQVHRGKIDLLDLKKRLAITLQDELKIMHEGIDRLLNTKTLTTKVEMKAVIAQLARNFSLPKRAATAVLEGYHFESNLVPDYKSSLFGAIQGFTRAGQKLDEESWVKFDSYAGQMAGWKRDDWETQTKRAAGLKLAEVEETFMAV